MKHKDPGEAEHYLLPDLSRCLIRAAAKLRLSGDAAAIRESWYDPGRFAVLFDTHFAEIYRYVARRLGLAAADDLPAEVFLAAFGQRHRYDLTQPSARPWLYGIATRLIGGHRRHEVARYRALARIRTDQHPDPPAGQAAAQERAQVARTLAALRAADRDLLLSAALTDLSHDEIAVALGIPAPAVRSGLCRVRGRLRTALGWAGVVPIGQGPVNGDSLLVRATLLEPARPAPQVVADAWALVHAPHRRRTAAPRRRRAGALRWRWRRAAMAQGALRSYATRR